MNVVCSIFLQGSIFVDPLSSVVSTKPPALWSDLHTCSTRSTPSNYFSNAVSGPLLYAWAAVRLREARISGAHVMASAAGVS